MTDQLMTPREVADYLQVGLSTVYRALDEGRIPGVKPLGRWRVVRCELEEHVRSARPTPHRRRVEDPMPSPRPRRGASVRAEVIELRRSA